jgi:hypothetical protein
MDELVEAYKHLLACVAKKVLQPTTHNLLY